jgi:conjugal transfer ATP-binding protein TraC
MLNLLSGTLKRWANREIQWASSKAHLKRLRVLLKEYVTLRHYLPFETFDPEHGLFFTSNSVGFVLETPALCGASDAMQLEIDGFFKHLLPEGSSLQTLLWADPYIGPLCDVWQASREGALYQKLAQKRRAHLERMTFQSPQTPFHLRHFRCVISYTQAIPQTDEEWEAFYRLQKQLITTLESVGLGIGIWNASHALTMLSTWLNLDPTCTHLDVRQWNPLQMLVSQYHAMPLSVEKDHLILNEGKIHARVYHADKLPAQWSLHQMGELIGDKMREIAQIPCPFWIHYGVHIPYQDKPRRQLFKKAAMIDRQARSPLGKWIAGLQEESEQLNFAWRAVQEGERIVQTQLTVVLLADPPSLPNSHQTLINLWRTKGWSLEVTPYTQLPELLSTLPMMWNKCWIGALEHLHQLRTTLSTEAANLLPLQGEWRGTNLPGLLLAGRRGQLMNWSPFDETAAQNFNVCVAGRPGSGKSVFMQELMINVLSHKGYVFVLDIGRSFEKTCHLLEGAFIEFTPLHPLCLNPFTHLPTEPLEATEDALGMLQSVLELMAAPKKGVDDLETALLQQALLATWKQEGQQATIGDIADWLLARDDARAKPLGEMLFGYAKGTYQRFFSGPATVDLNQSLVVMELEDLRAHPELKDVVVQLAILNITHRVSRGERRPFHIILDEAWDLLNNPRGKSFIERLVRTVRKYKGSLVVGTQSVNDFYSNPSAQTVFESSDWHCLLSQKSEAIAQLKQAGRLSLTDELERQLLSLKTKHGHYAEVMIKGPPGFAIARVLLDPYSQLLYSSRAEDYMAVKQLREQGMPVHQALEQVLAQRQIRREKLLT